jgi:hypothetical protein
MVVAWQLGVSYVLGGQLAVTWLLLGSWLYMPGRGQLALPE